LAECLGGPDSRGPIGVPRHTRGELREIDRLTLDGHARKNVPFDWRRSLGLNLQQPAYTAEEGAIRRYRVCNEGRKITSSLMTITCGAGPAPPS
jgi:hypothetical protein